MGRAERAQKARRVLGNAVQALTDVELDAYLVVFQCFIDASLDEYERSLFHDQTFNELQ